MSLGKNLTPQTHVRHLPGQPLHKQPRAARVVQPQPHAVQAKRVGPPVYRPLPSPQVLLPSAFRATPSPPTFPAPAALKSSHAGVAMRTVSTPSSGVHVAFARSHTAQFQMHASRGVAPAGRAGTPAVHNGLIPPSIRQPQIGSRPEGGVVVQRMGALGVIQCVILYWNAQSSRWEFNNRKPAKFPPRFLQVGHFHGQQYDTNDNTWTTATLTWSVDNRRWEYNNQPARHLEGHVGLFDGQTYDTYTKATSKVILTWDQDTRTWTYGGKTARHPFS